MEPDVGRKRSVATMAGHPERAPAVRQMFDRIAPRYDLTNRVLSLGFDRRWRASAIASLGPKARGEVLDLCAGTMDMTKLLLKAGATRVVALDFSEAMLNQGAARLPPGAPVEIVVADARSLPLPDASVDGIVCGFGLRNVPDLPLALAECARVLRPGGRLVVLELFRPRTALARLVQDSYNRYLVPLIGGWLTGSREAYDYLSTSIEAFMTRQEFETLCQRLGLAPLGREVFPPVAGLVIAIRQPSTQVTAVVEP